MSHVGPHSAELGVTHTWTGLLKFLQPEKTFSEIGTDSTPERYILDYEFICAANVRYTLAACYK